MTPFLLILNHKRYSFTYLFMKQEREKQLEYIDFFLDQEKINSICRASYLHQLDKKTFEKILQIKYSQLHQNKPQVNILSLELFKNILKLKYRTIFNFSFAWISQQIIQSYIKYALKQVQIQLQKQKQPKGDVNRYLYCANLLNSVHEILHAVPNQIRKKIINNKIQNKKKKKQKKKQKQKQKQKQVQKQEQKQHNNQKLNQNQNQNQKQIKSKMTLLQNFESIVNKIKNEMSQLLQGKKSDSFRQSMLQISKIKIWKIAASLNQLKENNHLQKNQLKKTLNDIFNFFSKLVGNIKKYKYNFEKLYIQRDMRFIFSNLVTKFQFSQLKIPKIFNDSVNTWCEQVSSTQSVYQMEHVKVDLYRATNDFSDQEIIKYVLDRQLQENLNIILVQSQINIRNKVKQIHQKYLGKNKIELTEQQFQNDIRYFQGLSKDSSSTIKAEIYIKDLEQKDFIKNLQNFGKYHLFQGSQIKDYINQQIISLKPNQISRNHQKIYRKISQKLKKNQNFIDKKINKQQLIIFSEDQNTFQKIIIHDPSILLQELLYVTLYIPSFCQSISKRLNYFQNKFQSQNQENANLRNFIQFASKLMKFNIKQSNPVEQQIRKIQQKFEKNRYFQGLKILRSKQDYLIYLNQNKDKLTSIFPRTYIVVEMLKQSLKKQLDFNTILKYMNKFKKANLQIQIDSFSEIHQFRQMELNTTRKKNISLIKWQQCSKKQFETCKINIYKTADNLLRKYKISFRDNKSIDLSQFIQLHRQKYFNDLFLIKQYDLDEKEIIVEKKILIFKKINDILRFIIKIFSQFKQDNSKIPKSLKNWYIFSKESFKILKKDNCYHLQVSFLPIIQRFCFGDNYFNKKLQEINKAIKEQSQGCYKINFDFPFVYIAFLIKNNLNMSQLSDNEKEQITQFIQQIKAIQLQNKPNTNNKDRFLDLPIFWSNQLKAMSIINFSQTFHNQLRIQQSRRKQNNLKYLELIRSRDLKIQKRQKLANNKQNRQQISQIQQQIQFYNNLIAQFRSRDHVQKQQKQTQKTAHIKQQFREEQDKQNAQLTYKYSNRMNMASSFLYTVEGVMQTDAYWRNLQNHPLNKQQNRQIYQFGSNYKWIGNKTQIKYYIIQMMGREIYKNKEQRNQQMKKRINGMLDDLKQGKDVNLSKFRYSNNQNEKKIHKKLRDVSFESLQAHLYFLRCFLSHAQRNPDGHEISLQQKINLVGKNYPKIFTFIYKWKDIIGKPMVSTQKQQKITEQQERSNQDYKKIYKKYYDAKHSQQYKFNFQHHQKIMKDIPQFWQPLQGSIKYQFVKMLSSIFIESDPIGNHDKIRKLQQSKKFGIKTYLKIFPDGVTKEKLNCNACRVYKTAFISSIQKQQNSVPNIWEFLNDVKRENFNFLFHQHTCQSEEKCLWPQLTSQSYKGRILYFYYNMLIRKNFIRDEQIQICMNNDVDALPKRISDRIFQDENSDEQMPNQNPRITRNQTPKKQQKDKPQANSTWNQYLNLPNQQIQKLREQIRRTDYLPKFFLYQLLINFPDFFQQLRWNRYVWDSGRIDRDSPFRDL